MDQKKKEKKKSKVMLGGLVYVWSYKYLDTKKNPIT